MHESSVARAVLRAVLERATEDGAVRILGVKCRIGELEALSSESLVFHFAVLARGTAAEGARLELQLSHVSARCRGCGSVYEPDHVVVCPGCGSPNGELLGEVGIRIETLEAEFESDAR